MRFEPVVYIQFLKRFEIDEDGSSINLFVTDLVRRDVRIAFPIEVISSLMVTLPKLVNAIVQRKDPSLRVVYPLGKHHFEQAADGSKRILTLATRDGFEVSFSVSEEQFAAFAPERGAKLRNQ
jgi:hypothetical protein